MTILNRVTCSLVIILIFELLLPKVNSFHSPCRMDSASRTPSLTTNLFPKLANHGQPRSRKAENRRDMHLNADSNNQNIGFDPRVVWTFLKGIAPPVVTGAYKDDEDVDAGGALYNFIFVRMPTIAGGILYFQRISDKAPPIMFDLGFGDLGEIELSPILVVAAMFLILRPANE